jgi:hypothetical protein
MSINEVKALFNEKGRFSTFLNMYSKQLGYIRLIELHLENDTLVKTYVDGSTVPFEAILDSYSETFGDITLTLEA